MPAAESIAAGGVAGGFGTDVADAAAAAAVSVRAASSDLVEHAAAMRTSVARGGATSEE